MTLNTIKTYPLRQYIEHQLWKPEGERTKRKGTQKEFAQHCGVVHMTVNSWCMKGYIIDDYGQLYGPGMKTERAGQ